MVEDVWTPENSQQLVQKYMRVCGYLCSDKVKHDEALSVAHAYAGQQNTKTQEEYALEFAKGLKIAMIKRFGQHAVDNYIESWREQSAQTYVATATFVAASKPLAKEAKKTVEEWEAEGLRFRPAVSRVVLAPIEEPQDNTPRRRSLEHAIAVERESVATRENAPWGKSAAKMAEWAWEIATGRKMPVNQRTVVADILSVLHHAGILVEGSIIPVGYGHKADVRGTRKEK